MLRRLWTTSSRQLCGHSPNQWCTEGQWRWGVLPKHRTPGNASLWGPLCPEERWCEMRLSWFHEWLLKPVVRNLEGTRFKKLITRRLEKEVEWALNAAIFVSHGNSPHKATLCRGRLFSVINLFSPPVLTHWQSGTVVGWRLSVGSTAWNRPLQNPFGYLPLPSALNMAP